MVGPEADPAGPAERVEVTREHAEGVIASLYRIYLRREPDADGFAHYVDELCSGVPEADIVHIFANSEEALAKPDVFVRARELEGEGRFVDALAEYDRLIEAGSDVSVAFTRRALLDSQLGAFKQMTTDFERAQAADAGDPYPWMWQGQYAKQMRRPHFAALCFEGAVRASPPKYLDEMRINLAEAYIRLDWHDCAAAQARKIPPDFGHWWASSRRAAVEGVPQRRAAIRDALRQRRASASGRGGKLLAMFRRRRAPTLDWAARLDLARNIAAVGRLSIAERLCVALMLERPRDFAAFELRGRILARRDGLEAALAFLRSLERRHRNTPEWVLATARILHDLGCFGEAIALGERSGKAHEDGELLAVIGFAYVGRDDHAGLGGFCRRWMYASDDAVPAAGLLVAAFTTRTRDTPVGRDTHVVSVPASPKRLHVVHFWDNPQVPGDVARVIASWARHNPEVESTVFNSATGAAFMAEHHGSEAAEAFALCHHPAMQADVFRIAYLATKGGLYADADEECMRPMPALLARAADAEIAAVRSGEVPDFLHNYFLGGRPGSETLRRALGFQIRDIRRHAQEQRQVDIWHYTGPGLLTRATGVTLADRLDTATPDEIVLIPLQQYRAFVRVAEELAYRQSAAGSWHLS